MKGRKERKRTQHTRDEVSKQSKSVVDTRVYCVTAGVLVDCTVDCRLAKEWVAAQSDPPRESSDKGFRHRHAPHSLSHTCAILHVYSLSFSPLSFFHVRFSESPRPAGSESRRRSADRRHHHALTKIHQLHPHCRITIIDTITHAHADRTPIGTTLRT